MTPCTPSVAVVSVLTGVAAFTWMRTRTFEGSLSSSRSHITCPTGSPL